MTDPVKQMWDNGMSSDDEWGALTIEPSGVSYSDAGPERMWIEPDDAAPDKVIFMLHGGGFVSGSFASHRKLAGHLAKAAGTRALPEPRRAFRHHEPARAWRPSRPQHSHDAITGRPAPIVIADLFGIHPGTAHRWAQFAGNSWADYLAALQHTAASSS